LVTTRIVKLAAFSLLAMGMVVSASCSGGASDSDLKKAQQELSDQQALNQQLQQQLADAKKAPASVTPAAAAAGALLGVKTVVPPTPAPTATPLPAGVTAPTAVPRATAPASYYQPVGPYFIYVETIATSTASKYNVASTLSCTPSGVFARGQRIVFRYDIVDIATGKRLTDRDTDTVVKVIAPNGDESTGRFSQRGGGQVPDAPFMFSGSWDIPLDFPLGAVDYKITITKAGQTFTWRPPYLTSEPLKEDTRPKVVQ
jgi:hypothetical protein